MANRLTSAKLFRFIVVGAFAATPLGSVSAQSSQAPAIKTINVYLPTAPGGAWDVFARILANHLSAHIPGNPSILVQYMPGAGGLKVLNHMYSTAPKDGSALAMALPTSLLIATLDPNRAAFKPVEFNWVGSMAPIQDVIFVRQDSPVKNIEDAKTNEISVGATGFGSNTFYDIAMSNHLLGTKFKIVLGYTGSAPINLAIERGEVQGRAGTWDDLSTNKANWLKERFVTPIVQIGRTKLEEIGNVPLFSDLVANQEDKRIATFLSTSITLGRVLLSPPGVSPDRVKIIRDGFSATMTDPEFLKEIQLRKLDVTGWLPGDELQDIVVKTFNQPSNKIGRAREILSKR